MHGDGLYLYAILAGEVAIDLAPTGGFKGSGPVSGIHAAGMTAVVGEYAGPPIDRLSRADALRRLIEHQAVIEGVMPGRSVLPVRLGTVLDSEDEVRRALTMFQRRLQAALRDVAGAVEIDLSASWDLSSVFEAIRAEPAIASLLQGVDAHAGGVSLATRLHAGQLVHDALDSRQDEYRHLVVETIRPMIRDMRSNPLPADDVVINLAVLVDRDRLPELENAVDRLGSEAGGQITFRFVGPLPPYSFGTVRLERLHLARVTSAIEVLGLEYLATRSEVRAAYRRLAAEYHPDQNRRDPDAAERFAAITAAYRLLTRYLDGRSTEDEEEHTSAARQFVPEKVGDTLLLEIASDDASTGFAAEVGHGSVTASP